MNSAFERLQKLAEEKKAKAKLELVAPLQDTAPVSDEAPLEDSAPVLDEAALPDTAPLQQQPPVPNKAPLLDKPAIPGEAPAQNKAPLQKRQPPLYDKAATPDTAPLLDTGAQGYTSIKNHVFDKVLRVLDPFEQVALIRLIRLSHGFQKTSCKISVPGLAAGCNIGVSKARAALNKLEKLELIKRGETDYSNPNQLDRGINFTILLPMPERPKSAPLSDKAPVSGKGIKDKEELKENIKKGKLVDVAKEVSFNFENQYRALRDLIDLDSLSLAEAFTKIEGYQITDDQKEQLKSAISGDFQ